MTICVCVKARDGLALVTDSMSQLQGRNAAGQVAVVKTYSNATKLFPIRGEPAAVMSYGIGNIGNRSIQGIMGDFKVSGGSLTSVEELSGSLFTFFKGLYDGEYGKAPMAEQPVLGFFVAGYAEGSAFAEEWEFVLPRHDGPRLVRDATEAGVSWRGVTVPFTRLHMGYDPRLLTALGEAGLEDTVREKVEKIVKGFGTQVVFNGMPVQDAVNLAVFIANATIGMSTFEAGPPSCGGPLQVATILRETGFAWVHEPELTL